MPKHDDNLKNQILHFVNSSPKEYHLREIARQLKIDPGNLSRELTRLEEEGYIHKVKRYNKYLYFSSDYKVKKDKYLDKNIDIFLKSAEPEIIREVQSLIRTPSVSGINMEEDVAKMIHNLAKKLDLHPQYIYKDKRRPNLVIDLESKPDNTKPFFLLIGHMDTVGPGEVENWDYYPFSGHIAGGKIYGRGAQDMKAGIVCNLYTLKAIKELAIDLPVTPRIILVSNEEGGSDNTPIFDIGMEHLIDEGFVEAVGAIYAYGGSYNIGIGHRGVLRINVKTFGESVHTGSVKWQNKEKGSNAVTGMAEILLALENLKLPHTKHPSFPKHENVITPGTMILHGGSAVSMVPDQCESIVEIRYLPGLKIHGVYNNIKSAAEKIARKRGIKVELHKFVDISAVSISPTDHIVQVLQKACEKIYKTTPGVRGTGPANESFMLIKRGIPTIVFGPIGSGAHSDNENIQIKSLTKTVRIYIDTLSNYSK